MKVKYVNPFTDFGFKKLFGEEASKPALIDFLNALLASYGGDKITRIEFMNNEQLGATIVDRKAIYDIYCENERGERYIVELQKARQDFFKERTIFYSTFPIRDMAERGGEWDFDLKAIYCIGILDFVFKDYNSKKEQSKVIHRIQLKDDDCKVFYDKLNYLYIEMPNFNKEEHELSTQLDKWLYFIKHLEDFQQIPAIFSGEEVFTKALEKANIDSYTRDQLNDYEGSLKVFRDLKNVVDSADRAGERRGIEKGIERGLQKGMKQGIAQIAAKMKANGLPIAVIVATTGLTESELEQL
jgi:predicted transposase/invertase (TIGR01784 family)